MSATDIETRLRFNLIDSDTRAALRELQPLIREELPRILDAFYAHIRGWPEVAKNFINESRMQAAGSRQLEHWMKIASGDFSPDYIRSAEKIGEVHARLGLEPRWYIGAYTFISSRLIHAIIAKSAGGLLGGGSKKAARLVEAVNKATLLDMDIVLSTIQKHAAQARVDELRGLADQFEKHVLGVVETVAKSATDMSQTANAIAATATTTEQRSAAVSAAAEQATSNVSVVAASAEEMGGSVREIAAQVAQAAKVAGAAVERASTTQETMQRLSNAADKIGAVVNLISDIAEQTNLLALNATIESARAGEAGKGFAVVAAEVKSLATQTAKATEDIGIQIHEMQGITRQSVDAISTIRSTIDEINSISVSINAAIEEQSAATQEIARSTQEAASGTQEVSSNISAVLTDARKTGAASAEAVKATDELGRQAGQLREEVQNFLRSVRAA